MVFRCAVRRNSSLLFDYRFILLLTLISLTLFVGAKMKDDDDEEQWEEDDNDIDEDESPRVTEKVIVDAKEQQPIDELCNLELGDISSTEFYEANPDFLVVYINGATKSINYKTINWTSSAYIDYPHPTDCKRSYDKHVCEEFRLFPHTFTNYIVGVETGDHTEFIYFRKTVKKPPFKYEIYNNKGFGQVLDLNYTAYIPKSNFPSKNCKTPQSCHPSFYNAQNCKFFGRNISQTDCEKKKICRIGKSKYGEILRCHYDIAKKRQVRIYKGRFTETAHGVLQGNYFWEVKNMTTNATKTIISHGDDDSTQEGRRIVCIDQPMTWHKVHIARYTGTRKDFKMWKLYPEEDNYDEDDDDVIEALTTPSTTTAPTTLKLTTSTRALAVKKQSSFLCKKWLPLVIFAIDGLLIIACVAVVGASGRVFGTGGRRAPTAKEVTRASGAESTPGVGGHSTDVVGGVVVVSEEQIASKEAKKAKTLAEL